MTQECKSEKSSSAIKHFFSEFVRQTWCGNKNGSFGSFCLAYPLPPVIRQPPVLVARDTFVRRADKDIEQFSQNLSPRLVLQLLGGRGGGCLMLLMSPNFR